MADLIDRFNGEQKSCFPIKNCGAVLGAESFLMRLEDTNVLIDTGYGFCAQKLTENIKKELNGEKLDYILLTHSHYDHALGSAACKRAFPESKIVASEYCARILEKDSARAAIRKMDISVSKVYGWQQAEDLTGELSVDIKVHDGEHLMIGSHDVEIIALPGHTKCCIGYYFCAEKFLISCETIGVYVGNGKAMPGCLVGYQMTLDSIDRILDMPVEQMLISHNGMMYGEDIKNFLRESRESTVEGRKLVINAWQNGESPEKIGLLFRNAYYSDNVARYYPEAAFRANLAAQIPMFIQEYTQSQK